MDKQASCPYCSCGNQYLLDDDHLIITPPIVGIKTSDTYSE